MAQGGEQPTVGDLLNGWLVPAAFSPLPAVPDHLAIEHAVLEIWDKEGTFEKLRERNRNGPRWSFIDGPITANNPMGVHHCWGRSLKDMFQRYKAMRGFHQRYQNGFDSQGLWVEVEVERALGLNSKREIERYGLEEFAQRCKERVAKYSAVITDQSKRLGMWMDWKNSYFTFSDTNIEYIWRFLKVIHERGWLYKGHRATPWCPRCGTSLSEHEQYDSYRDLKHPSLYVRFPILERKGEALVVWTTTPWTLPANVAAAVDPEASYVLLDSGNYVAEQRLEAVPFRGQAVRSIKGSELVGLEYEGPFDGLPAQRGVVHRVVPWDEVSMDEGTGIVHIAPGAGSEDFELGKKLGLPVLIPIDESGRFVFGYGDLEDLDTERAASQILAALRERGALVQAGQITHRYPICWRCSTPLVFRVVDDWFIRAGEIRSMMLAANATVEWTPDFYSKRMDDWLRNMEDWNISRKRYFGLPLPFYPCDRCGKLTVVGSVEELRTLATAGLDHMQELHRPWIDRVLIRCPGCGNEGVRRIPEVGDAWLDAGIVPFSTLGWHNPTSIPGGYATGASRGLSQADLPDQRYWEAWFPADWICEMREQIRLWFYSQSFMSVTLENRSPYRRVLTYEKVRDDKGREMHKSWGNAIDAQEALDRMGADVMRWIFAEQNPGQDLNFGFGRGDETRRELLTFWNSLNFFVTYANIEHHQPSLADLEYGLSESDLQQPLDRWLGARVQQMLLEIEAAYERWWTPSITRAFDAFIDDLSNWYIRRSRSRFYGPDQIAFRILWYALVQATRVIAPVMPFLAEHLWRNLVAGACTDAPQSVFLAGWPQVNYRLQNQQLLEEVAEARRIVELGRQARAAAGIPLRQPLSSLVVDGGQLTEDQTGAIKDELRVHDIRAAKIDALRVTLKANFRVLGPRLGPDLVEVARALESGRFERLADGRIRVNNHTLEHGDVISRYAAPDGWALAQDDRITVMLNTQLNPELRFEGRLLELIHTLNGRRKQMGLDLTDRIRVVLPSRDADLLRARSWIAEQVLAVEISANGKVLSIEKAEAAPPGTSGGRPPRSIDDLAIPGSSD